MARREFELKRNDTSRPIKFYPKANPASDFTGASVVFNMASPGGCAKVDRGVGLISVDTGGTFFLYEWTASDTDTAGDFDAEFEVTLSDGKVETYPNFRNLTISILEDLG